LCPEKLGKIPLEQREKMGGFAQLVTQLGPREFEKFRKSNLDITMTCRYGPAPLANVRTIFARVIAQSLCRLGSGGVGFGRSLGEGFAMIKRLYAACIGALVVLGMGLLVLKAPGQELPPKTYMSKNVFYLPVRIEDKVRATLREVQLYSKDNPSKKWVLQERASPSQTYFTFRAPHDGEYWFTVVTVDKAGHPIPADIRTEAPGLIVVLDTQLPQVDVQSATGPAGEGTFFRCFVKDDNPDLTKTRFYYQTGDSWRSLAPVPGQADQYCIPAQTMFTGMVKVEACDLAGNTVNREFNMGTMQAAVQGTMPAAMPGQEPLPDRANPMPTDKATVKTMPIMTVETTLSQAPAAFPVEQVSGPDIEPQQRARPATNTTSVLPAKTRMPKTTSGDVMPGPVFTAQKSRSINTYLVNRTHVFLQYQIDRIGASGIGKVEVWMTPDRGQTWQKLSEDCKQPGVIEVDLPGEGNFGVRLVMSNGRGFGATPPAVGESPDWWIEVDTTMPVLEARGVRLGAGADSGCAFITWSAQDKNLAGEPIDLDFALSPKGPWQSIAQNLKNDGHYCWRMPAYLGPEAYIRIIAHDTAGNMSVVDFPQPVPLDDMSRPRGRLTGISTAAPMVIHENDAPQTVDSRR
jgi:hypothetical protein